MKSLLVLLCLFGLSCFAAGPPPTIWRNFWTTNANAREVVAAGTNCFVTFSTSGTDVRTYTIDVPTNAPTPSLGVTSGTNIVVTTNGTVVTVNGFTDTNIVNLLAAHQASLATNGGVSTLSIYASNVLSGGQIPLGTVSTGLSAVAGPFLTTNGVARSYSFNGGGLTNVTAAAVSNGVGITNATLAGPTIVGIVTNTGNTFWTGGETRTNYSTGNWMKYTNGVSSWGLSNNGATITADGVIGVITLSGPAPSFALKPNSGGEIDIGVGGSTNLIINAPIAATSFSGSGAALTGVVDSTGLTNVARLNAANTFTAAQTFSGTASNSFRLAPTNAAVAGVIYNPTNDSLSASGTIFSPTFSGIIASVNSTPHTYSIGSFGLSAQDQMIVMRDGTRLFGFGNNTSVGTFRIYANPATIVADSAATLIVGNGLTSPLYLNGNPTVAGTLTATNGVFGAYGCLTMSTGVVTVATSASTNQFSAWSYLKTFGGMGTETNSNIVVTNAGDYRISFGCSMKGGNSDAIKTLVFTNGVVCTILMFEKTMQSPAIAETGFKEFVVTLPALCRVSLYVADLSANSVDIQNACLNVKGAN